MNAPVTTTGAELNRIVADAVADAVPEAVANGVAKALKDLGFGARKAPKIGYSVKEAADASGLGRTTIYSAVRQGELRMVKKGARSIILDRDLRRWLEGLPPSNVSSRRWGLSGRQSTAGPQFGSYTLSSKLQRRLFQ